MLDPKEFFTFLLEIHWSMPIVWIVAYGIIIDRFVRWTSH